jgi:type I restriction enzyme S subunit
MKKYPKYKDSEVEWIGKIPDKWKLIKIKNTCEIVNEQIPQSELNGKKVIHYSIPNVQQTGIGQLEDGDDIDSSKIIINGGEILFSKLNPRKGTTCFVSKNDEYQMVCSGEFITMIPKTNLPKFHLFVISCSTFIQFIDSQVESVTRSHQRVRPENFLSSLIPIPPLQEQQQIVTYLDQKTSLIDQIISNSDKKIELLKEQRTSTINHIVTKGLNPKVKMKDSGVEWIGEIPAGCENKKLKYCLKHIHSNERKQNCLKCKKDSS